MDAIRDAIRKGATHVSEFDLAGDSVSVTPAERTEILNNLERTAHIVVINLEDDRTRITLREADVLRRWARREAQRDDPKTELLGEINTALMEVRDD